MRDIEWTGHPERDKFPKGPWTNECDKAQWLDKDTKLVCLIVRNQFGAWCGYVGVDGNSCLYGEHYDDLRNKFGQRVDCHGGLTYADESGDADFESIGIGSINHIPESGESYTLWWFGFDCSHLGDLYPLHMEYAMKEYFAIAEDILGTGMNDDNGDKYRDMEYVKSHVTNLARQIHEIEEFKQQSLQIEHIEE